MPNNITRLAHVVGNGKVRVQIVAPIAPVRPEDLPTGVFSLTNWTVQYYNGGWATPIYGEAIRDVRAQPGDQDPGLVTGDSINYLDLTVSPMVHGLDYRLVGVFGAVTWYTYWHYTDPRQLSLEVEGYGTIRQNHIDRDRLPSGISQKVNVLDQKVDVDGLTVYLVDLDDVWSTAINPHRANETVDYLDGAITAAAGALTMVDSTGFNDGDYVYIGRECILLGGKAGNAFAAITRAQKATVAAAHADGAKISTVNPAWEGRCARLYVGSNPVWSGVVKSLAPETATCLVLDMEGGLAALDVPVNQFRAVGVLSSAYYAGRHTIGEGETSTYHYTDRFYLKSLVSGLTSAVEIPSGYYDTSEQTFGSARNLFTAVETALNEIGLLNTVFTVELAEKIVIRMDSSLYGWGDFTIQLYDSGATSQNAGPTGSVSSLLYALGFDGVDITFPQGEEVNGRFYSMVEAQSPWKERAGLNARAPMVILDTPTGSSQFDSDDFTATGYMVVGEDEIIGYKRSLSASDAGNLADTTITEALGNDPDVDTTLTLADASHFAPGIAVLIDSEIIILGRLNAENLYEYEACTRAAFGTAVDNHADNSAVYFVPLPWLFDLQRGIGGKPATNHAPGTAVRQIYRSPYRDPIRSANDLLSELEIPTYISTLTEQPSAEGIVNPIAAFRKYTVKDDESYLDVVNDMMRPGFCFVAPTYTGQLQVDTIRPLTSHETADFTLTAASFVAPPQMEYVDKGRMSVYELEYNLGLQKSSKIIQRDKRDPDSVLFRRTRQIIKQSINCIDSFEGLDYIFRLSRKLFFTYSRARMAFRGTVPWSVGSSMSLFDRVTLAFPQIPNGRGTRGLTAATTHFYLTEINRDYDSMTVQITGEEGITGRGFNFSALVEAGNYDPLTRKFTFTASSTITSEPFEQPGWDIRDYITVVDKMRLTVVSDASGTYQKSMELTVSARTYSDGVNYTITFADTNFTDTGGGNYYPDDDPGPGQITPAAGMFLESTSYGTATNVLLLLCFLANANGYLDGGDTIPGHVYTI